MNLENHCGNAGCVCTHTHGCEHGWIWGVYIDEQVIKRNTSGARDAIRRKYDGVQPCPVCYPDKYDVYISSKSHEEYHEKLRNRGTFKRQKAYEEDERSRTRTL